MNNELLTDKHRLCFPFCQDLGNKQFSWKNLDDQINIKWALFRLKQHAAFFSKTRSIPNSDIIIPGLYEVRKIAENDLASLLKSEEYQTFIAPNDYYNDKELVYDNVKAIVIDLPNELKEQPHLYKHSTFQFYHLRNSLFTCSLQFVAVDQENKLRAVIRITSAPSGTYFYWKSGEIFFKWKIEVRQGIVNISLIDETNKAMKQAMSSIAEKIPVVGGMLSGAKKGVDNMTQSLAENAIYGKDTWNKMGLDRERINRLRELQTARMFTSTSLTGETMLEPSIFYTNSEHFSYNLFDFFLRAGYKPHWESRIYISKTLFNNLKISNNINPITYPLNITFEKLANILRSGFIQGSAYLDHDPNNKMTEVISRGVHFYDDKRRYFVNPNLTLAGVRNDSIQLGAGGDSYIAQAITDQDEPWENNITRTKGSNFHQRAHFFVFYEDGSKDHWLVLFPQSFQDSDLAQGHTHGGFQITFDKPVSKMIDVYTCIGCGASGQGFHVLNNGYDTGTNDSLDRINKGLPFDPWYNDFTGARLNDLGQWTTPNGKCLGSRGDVWEFTGQYIVGKDNKPFSEAYGFIPTGGTIQWTTKGQGSTRIEWQKQPTNNDFSNLDWSPPPGSGGEIEIPLQDPEIAIPEPGEGDAMPEDDFTPDTLDISGGEVEIPAIEIDLPPDITQDLDNDQSQDPDPPPIDVDPPQDTDTSQDQDNSQDTGDQDHGDQDPPQDYPGRDDDDDAD